MTVRHLSPADRSPERGTALIGVLLLLMLMSALAAALAVSGRTETLVARNHVAAAQARMAAEAGLNHAAEVVISWILAWKSNGYTSVDQALDVLLAGVAGNPDFLAGVTFGDDEDPIPIAGAADADYHVFLMDEDDPARDGYTNLDNAENNDATTDLNQTLVIQAVGYGPNGAIARLEAIVSPYKLPAIAVNGDLEINGNANAVEVGSGSTGGVHANGNLSLSGVVTGLDFQSIPPDASKGTATASGAYDDDGAVVSNPGGSGGAQAALDMPDINASDFRSWADIILEADGALAVVNGPTQSCVGPPANVCDSLGWRYSNSGGTVTWSMQNNNAEGPDGDGYTYYVEGHVDLVGGTAANSVTVTIIAEGSISSSGGAFVTPHSSELLFVTDQDLNLSGNFQVSLAEGQILVREQVSIQGAVGLMGQLVVQNATDTPGSPVDQNVISTSSAATTMINNTDIGSSLFRVSGWREVR